jgi:predicted permease
LVDALSAWLPALEFPVNADIPTDWRVVVFAVSTSHLSALASSLLPSLSGSAVDPAPALKNETPLARLRRFHFRDVFVAVQVAVSIVLLTGAVMMVRTLQRSLRMDFGFRPAGAVALRFDLGMQGYDEERGHEFGRRLLERLEARPGIDAVAIANSIPFSIDHSFNRVYLEGKPIPPVSQAVSAIYYQTTPGLFRALGSRLLSGRDFEERDDADAPPVAVVNRTFAERLLSGEDPLGKRFRFGPGGRPVEIVGVVEAGKYQTLTESPQPAVWVPLAQSYNPTSTVVLRSRLREDEALTLVERAVAEMDPEMPVFDAKPLRGYLDLPLMPLRVTTASLTAMGGLAVFLSALGLYGVVAYSTSRRTREIGIRMALGAGPFDVLQAVLSRTVLLVTASAAVGLGLSLLTTALLGDLLYASADPWVYLVAVSLLGGVSLVACLFPARRAVHAPPLAALRYE